MKYEFTAALPDVSLGVTATVNGAPIPIERLLTISAGCAGVSCALDGVFAQEKYTDLLMIELEKEYSSVVVKTVGYYTTANVTCFRETVEPEYDDWD